MGDTRVEYMPEEERGERAVERQDLAGEDRIAGQDELLVDAPAERGPPRRAAGSKTTA